MRQSLHANLLNLCENVYIKSRLWYYFRIKLEGCKFEKNMNKFLDEVYNYIKEYHMVEPSDRIVIGLSGGADSVCLLVSLCMLSGRLGTDTGNLFAVHVNHMLRGEAAEHDEAFSRELCEKLGVHFIGYRKDIGALAEELHCTVEEAGREYRYACFSDTAQKFNCQKIAVAHNKNDLAETVLFHIIRGSGLKGLSGISPVRDRIIRPLLNMPRQTIEEFLEEINQNYCTDATNFGTDYDRNRIRHAILPVMEQINSAAVDHICQVAAEAKESYRYIRDQALAQYGGCTENTDGKTVALDIGELYKCSPVLQEHMIHEAITDVAGGSRDVTRRHVMAVVGLIYQDTGKSAILPYGIRARRSYDRLIISNAKEQPQAYCINILENGVYEIPEWGSIEIEHMKYKPEMEISKKTYTKMFDYGKIGNNLCIRTPQEGDYITIDSEGNTKKLSRVFIDSKIDRELRNKWPVLACGREIIWAVGLRYNISYGVDENTKHVLYMKCTGKGE